MLEIISFYVPEEKEKYLYISQLSGNENDVKEFLVETFGQFGLLHDVYLYKSSYEIKNIIENIQCYYAIVSFYSVNSSKIACEHLQNSLFYNNQKLIVKLSSRNKISQKKILTEAKCYRLINHFLGFNGWSSNVIYLNEIKSIDDNSSNTTLIFECKVSIIIHKINLTSFANSISSINYSLEDPLSKLEAYKNLRKEVHRLAIQKAFSKILLIVLENGKVYPELNYNELEPMINEDESYIKVNELDSLEESNSEDEDI